MSVFQYKAKAFGGGESSSSSDDDVSDGEFERELERQRRAEAEAKEKKGSKKKKSPAKTKAPTRKKQRETIEIDDDVEAFAPAINVDDEPKASPPKKKKARKKQESSDDDDDADEDTKRRLRMLRESRAAREAMRQAERKVENLAESDDEPYAARGQTLRARGDYPDLTERPAWPRPEWADAGAIVAIQGGTRQVRQITHKMLAAGVPVAAGILYPVFGLLLSPVFAAAAMSLSSVSVIGNALRLRGLKL